jgi:hypothetical protein
MHALQVVLENKHVIGDDQLLAAIVRKGTEFTCFTSTKVQILTQKADRALGGHSELEL